MGKLSKIKLIPVIELMPSSYSKNNCEILENSNSEDAWETYKQKCYMDSGLENINEIGIGGCFFEIDKLTNENLKIILTKIFEERLDEDFTIEMMLEDIIDYSPLICGGYILNINNENLNHPGCCCGLETIKDWEYILDEESGNIWNGHGSNTIDFKKEGTELIFIIDNKSFYILKIEEFIKELDNTNKIINKFLEKSGPILNEIFKIENGYDLAKSMIYKWL